MSACLDCHRNAHSRFPDLKNINIGPDNCFACHR
jgi:predicted CXXCH cytochrome family protein